MHPQTSHLSLEVSLKNLQPKLPWILLVALLSLCENHDPILPGQAILASCHQVHVGGIVSEMGIMTLCQALNVNLSHQTHGIASGAVSWLPATFWSSWLARLFYLRLSRNFVLALGYGVVIRGYATFCCSAGVCCLRPIV